MKGSYRWLLMSTLFGCMFFPLPGETTPAFPIRTSAFWARTHCLGNEKVVFSCGVKRSGKIVSLCSSKKLTKTAGYIQYRFGLPGKIELEFPKDRSQSLKVFKYSHYFRALVDYTRISFSVDGYTYSVFDDYNAEGEPTNSEKGLTITADNTKKEVKYLCQGKPVAHYEDLPDVFENSWPGN